MNKMNKTNEKHDHNKFAPCGIIKVFLIELNWIEKEKERSHTRGFVRAHKTGAYDWYAYSLVLEICFIQSLCGRWVAAGEGKLKLEL